MVKTKLTDIIPVDYPIIMAPMFLVSNTAMIKAALDAGITAAFPALNYRTDAEFRAAIDDIRAHTKQPFGVNLIVNKSNPKYKSQLTTCVEKKVDYIITSLGSPEECIRQCKPQGIKVICDVIDLKYALKVQELGADAVIAVNSIAGGHAGHTPLEDLVPELSKALTIPVISAGGVAFGKDIKQAIDLGAAGVSVGTVFIASNEAGVSQDYKQAMVDYNAKDIVKTTKMSGSALTVINTPYVQSIGTKASWLEKLMHKNKSLKKYIKMFIFLRGTKAIENAAFKATYKTVWVAGPSIEHIHAIKSVKEIAEKMCSELEESMK
ncbi:MAG: nitronate monooxygenase [Salibacteraceae bacterium]|nr:nitronate monooxygenase [Salibacteraceae bacterium]MDP4685393.1 nitronate monooxygenase [Salibacteraceae bacterium]MDP4762337.1 nitronate monooxygenase [Salibacteraceae bacterium]MDP4842844.1 nitronate monooxygenase [Salibacteraceae bacterium]